MSSNIGGNSNSGSIDIASVEAPSKHEREAVACTHTTSPAKTMAGGQADTNLFKSSVRGNSTDDNNRCDLIQNTPSDDSITCFDGII